MHFHLHKSHANAQNEPVASTSQMVSPTTSDLARSLNSESPSSSSGENSRSSTFSDSSSPASSTTAPFTLPTSLVPLVLESQLERPSSAQQLDRPNHHTHLRLLRPHTPFRSKKADPPVQRPRPRRARSSTLPLSAAATSAQAAEYIPGPIVRPEYPSELETYTQYDRFGYEMALTQTQRKTKCIIPCLGYCSAGMEHNPLSSEHWGAPPQYPSVGERP